MLLRAFGTITLTIIANFLTIILIIWLISRYITPGGNINTAINDPRIQELINRFR